MSNKIVKHKLETTYEMDFIYDNYYHTCLLNIC